MKRTLKYLIVAAVLLTLAIAVTIGIAASTSSAEIKYVNLSLKMNLEVKYAVSAKNLPEGAELGVVVNVGSPDSDDVRETEYQGITTINGSSYYVYALPINATEYSTNLYAKPYIKNGSAVAYDEEKRDSVIKYVRNMRTSLSADIVEMLDSMLKYGASAQKYLKVNTDRLADADFYENRVVNGVFSDGYTTGLFANGESITLTPTLEKGTTVKNWTDSTGTVIGTDAVITVTAPAKNETYTANLEKSDVSIEYVLDGGTLPSGKWNSYPDDADFTLPVPTKAGYKFCGWYTEDGYGLSTIPAGSTDYFVLTAKWAKIVLDNDCDAIGKFSFLSTDQTENKLSIADGNLLWNQGTVAISQTTLNMGKPHTLLGGEKLFTYEIDLALAKDLPCFDSDFHFRTGSARISVMKTTSSGTVTLGTSGTVIAKLTEQMQRITIAIDFENLTFTAYTPDGKEIAKTNFAIPDGYTAESYYSALGDPWRSVTSGKTTSALIIGRMAILSGNAGSRGAGLPVTVADSKGESDYRIVYDSDSAVAEDAANELAVAIKNLGFAKPDVKSDALPATVSEIVIGDADRADVAEIKAYLADSSKIASDDYWWAYMYKSGKLYILSDSSYGYSKAISMLTSDYLDGDKLVVYSEFKRATSIDRADAILESILDPDPHDAYMSYKLPSNFYAGYTDPFGMQASDYKKMKLTHTNEKTYLIEYADERGGTWQTTFVMKRWGCWMMGALIYVDTNGKSTTIQGPSTDYEFVLNCAANDQTTFRGGNHGDYPKVYGSDWVWDAEDSSKSNDRLLDLTFYDGKSGEKIVLSVGQSISCDGIRIVMHNNVYEFDYKKENVLINVEKSYLYNGYDILCDSKLYMTKDVRFTGATYPCMLPISKKYGDSMFIYNMDGTVDYVQTLPYGETTEKIHGGHLATKVELWGPENPALHMTVEILNPDHQFISSTASGYLKIKDMSTTSNKIYFSSFTNNKTVKKGTELHYQSKWSFSYQADFVAPDRAPDLIIQ